MIFITSLHSFKHCVAFWVIYCKWSSSEIICKEVSKTWGLSGSSVSNSKCCDPSSWVWWNKECRIVEFKSLHIWVLKISSGQWITSLEWVQLVHLLLWHHVLKISSTKRHLQDVTYLALLDTSSWSAKVFFFGFFFQFFFGRHYILKFGYNNFWKKVIKKRKV